MSSFVTIPNSDLLQTIADTATSAGVDPNLAIEVATQESSLDQTAVSPAGAVGVMQLEPPTAADLGVNPYDTQQNIQGGVQYLSQLLSEFGGNTAQALAAYDAGPNKVNQAISTANASGSGDWLSLLPSETQNYVSSILGNLGTAYSASIGAATSPGVAPSGGNSVLTSVLLLTAGVFGIFLVSDLIETLAD
jgi:soluble lytic murein transglycosylase-like protein